MITGINIIRNGIENGYPFVESVLSALPLVDEYLMNDGGSTDGTLEVLKKMEETFPKFRVTNIPDIPNIRWDSCSDQLNTLIKMSHGDWIFLANADELLHERDIHDIRRMIENTGWPIIRYKRREISQNWRRLSKEVYHPARSARKTPDLHQNWNSYGGDEFLHGKKWIDPERTLISDFIIYHLYDVFPANSLNKRQNDAEYLAPGDKHRVKIYERMKGGKRGRFTPPKDVYDNLPALARGLPYMESYQVRECLFDKAWLLAVTGHKY
jgi:glycosyltransferase involved in cell wall biosynthesis